MIQSWKNFPWQKIYLRLLMIQQKIFRATRKYKKQYLYKLQKYLLNSNEGKLISVYYITNSIKRNVFTYNSNRYKNNLHIDDKQRSLILKLLFFSNINHSSSLYFIVEQIKQYLIYLCIKPEWDAKFYLNHNKLNEYFSYCLSNIDYFQRFQVFFSKSIAYWLNNKYFIEYINKYLLNSNNRSMYIYQVSAINMLKHIISIISLLSYMWNNFIFSKYSKIKFFNGYNLTYIGIYNIFKSYISNKYFYKENAVEYMQSHSLYTKMNILYSKKTFHYNLMILKIIKLIMYKKNSINKWVKFNGSKIRNIVNKIRSNIYLFYKYNLVLTNNRYWFFLYTSINRLLYYWQKKQSSNLQWFNVLNQQIFHENFFLYVLEYQKYYHCNILYI